MTPNREKTPIATWIVGSLIAVLVGALLVGQSIISIGNCYSRLTKLTKETSAAKTQSAPTPTTVETKKALSESKLQEAGDLKMKLSQKIDLLKSTDTKFDHEIALNAGEVRIEMAQTPIKTFEQSIENRRIRLALEAIQKAQAYKEIVDRESRLAREALLEAEGIEKQLRLDIIMLASLNEAKLDELLAKLDLVINKIQPQAKELVIADEQTNLKPLKDIYQEVSSSLPEETVIHHEPSPTPAPFDPPTEPPQERITVHWDLPK